jgi:pimeloyl-ACP methyl ester carboxylesterase
VATFVLVHGAWHGAWCWDKVAPLLRAKGHTVVAPDLPGHGDDPTPRGEVTLESYGKRVADVVSAQREKPIVVGHSMGGMVISAAAEMVPDRIARLVYLAAFLPRDGESLGAIEEGNDKKTVPLALVIEEGSPTATVDPAKINDLFYHDVGEEEAAAAKAKLTPQPLAPFGTPLRLSPDRFGKVRRAYIVCTEDKAIVGDFQNHMIAKSGVETVKSLRASHSPFLSMPKELTEMLDSLS